MYVHTGADRRLRHYRKGKLYAFGESLLNKGSGTKSWNERGVGEVKLLKHRDTAHIRVLMRQEKTMKVISNHVLDPRIIMTPNSSASDRSWVWTAYDFADGELVETVSYCVCVDPVRTMSYTACY